MKKALVRKILKYLKIKCWGIKLESELPPEFIISTHAEERLKERFRSMLLSDTSEIIIRAWFSNRDLPKKYDPPVQYDLGQFLQYKQTYFMGYVWIFGIRRIRKAGYTQKVLLTVIHHYRYG